MARSVAQRELHELLLVQLRLQTQRERVIVPIAAQNRELADPTLKADLADHILAPLILPIFDLDRLDLVTRQAMRKLKQAIEHRKRHILGVVNINRQVDRAGGRSHERHAAALVLRSDLEMRRMRVKFLTVNGDRGIPWNCHKDCSLLNLCTKGAASGQYLAVPLA